LKLSDVKIAYFLGIGGIGMSAIARYFHAIGIEVHGYDKTRNDFTIQLENEGFIIHYKEQIEAIPEQVFSGKRSIVIYTPAIPKDHQEFVYLLSKQVRIYKRAEVLGMISQDSFTIAVAGTHGKTTTSSMVAHMLNECGINFTAFLGGISSNFNNNYFHKNDGISMKEKPVMVVEADEFDRSFLKLSPDISIITSTDADHLDIYGEAEEVKHSFQEFADRIHEDGVLIVKEQLDLTGKEQLLHYGKDQTSDARYSDVEISGHKFHFSYAFKDLHLRVINGMPGFHNVENATAAITACICLGVPAEEVIAACSSFKGVRRRFEYVVDTETHVVIDDYAHHPTELKACIHSVKQLYPSKKLTGVFQPHLYSRTRDFADGFAEALDMLDECWLLDIYPARELPIEGINTEFLALKMHKTPQLMAKENVVKKLEEEGMPELLLLLGAGDIDQLVKPIKNFYAQGR
jgi:UDP-N-acetylmuramate--alanine ligase